MTTPPDLRFVHTELDGRIGRLVLAQPDRLNPMGTPVLEELIAAARWFDRTEASVVVVAGEGRAFSAGFDRAELGGAPVRGSKPTPDLGADMAEAIRTMRALTVASIQGPCVGGGLVLALACDLRVLADDAWCSLPEAELGLPLAWSGVPLLVRTVGASRAIDLILTCRRVGADEALRLGLADRVVPAVDLAAEVRALAAGLAERDPEVVRTTKAQVAAAAEDLVASTGAAAGTEHLTDALRRILRSLDRGDRRRPRIG
ncbi:MAG: enoyl-CoA hydratase/isomerase family protein [Acidimicrobiales bacterium]